MMQPWERFGFKFGDDAWEEANVVVMPETFWRSLTSEEWKRLMPHDAKSDWPVPHDLAQRLWQCLLREGMPPARCFLAVSAKAVDEAFERLMPFLASQDERADQGPGEPVWEVAQRRFDSLRTTKHRKSRLRELQRQRYSGDTHVDIIAAIEFAMLSGSLQRPPLIHSAKWWSDFFLDQARTGTLHMDAVVPFGFISVPAKAFRDNDH